ncbi:MAG: aldehyde dehydrogenase family protein, partial [Bacteroidota bacterium]
EMATRLVQNGKSRLSVCNAIDKVLINEKLPNLEQYIPTLVGALQAQKLEVYGTAAVAKVDNRVQLAEEGEAIFYEEFLSPKILLDTTPSLEAAIRSINKYSGGHSAVIVAEDSASAQHFQEVVDCAAVYHNASSRFTDGGQFGFGAEMAISTQKLHFRGPIGVAQLVTNKWFIMGNGQTRG